MMKAIYCCLDKLNFHYFSFSSLKTWIIFKDVFVVESFTYFVMRASPSFFSMIMEVEVVVEAEPAQPPAGKYILDIRWI